MSGTTNTTSTTICTATGASRGAPGDRSRLPRQGAPGARAVDEEDPKELSAPATTIRRPGAPPASHHRPARGAPGNREALAHHRRWNTAPADTPLRRPEPGGGRPDCDPDPDHHSERYDALVLTSPAEESIHMLGRERPRDDVEQVTREQRIGMAQPDPERPGSGNCRWIANVTATS